MAMTLRTKYLQFVPSLKKLRARKIIIIKHNSVTKKRNLFTELGRFTILNTEYIYQQKC